MANAPWMNRRKAVTRLALLSGGILFAYSGISTYKLFKKPGLESLPGFKSLLDALADTIIPATNTPGAKEAGLSDFIIRMVKDCTSTPAQNKFIDGLHNVDAYTKNQFGKTFIACSAAERNKAMQHFENEGLPYKGMLGKAEHRYLGDPFFITLKKYVVIGFCTSQVGATQALQYEYIPGHYIADMPLKPEQPSWATQ